MNRGTFDSWMQSDLAGVERFLSDELLHPSISSHHAYTLAYRSLVRSRMKLYDLAIDDAKKSIEVQRSAIGHIAIAIVHAGSGEPDAAMRVYDLVFSEGVPIENNLLLLIKAIVLFECGKQDDAFSRIDDLIDIVDNKSIYLVARAQLVLFSRSIPQKKDHGRTLALFVRALEAVPFQKSPHLLSISLIFGWKLDGLANAIRQYIQDTTQPFENIGDAAMHSENPSEANIQYFHALCLNTSNPAGLFIKRSKARALLALWDDSLEDAEEAIKADPQSPWGYERKYTALHSLQRYGEAIDAINHMLPLIKKSSDLETRELVNQFISPSKSEEAIITVVREVLKICPIVPIDIKSGCLCDGPEPMSTFRSELECKKLVLSMIRELDHGRIRQVVADFLRYVTFSHVWQGEELSYQNVKLAGSIWGLDGSSLNDKLRTFCRIVGEDGYRCSLKMMYKWYKTSTATFVYLADVDSLSARDSLLRSIWMTRAWTSQELLVPKVIRFYDHNWKPYRGDTRPNHKESPEIMQELADAIGISRLRGVPRLRKKTLRIR
ncbi:hypothetical protein JVU11DRAFT_7792 [Chiua virens]|nr:hypothetical protein JVU11DRAFT_7792 [Chiua virens]